MGALIHSKTTRRYSGYDESLIIDGKHKLDKQNLSFYGGGY
jgi:hypothetical protein